MKWYNTNTTEYLEDGYFDDNTMNCYEKYPAFYKTTSDVSGTVEIYEINCDDIKSKELTESLIKTESLSFANGKAYFLEATADHVGIFKYKMILPDSPYYSEAFRIIDSPTRETFTLMKSGMLKFYNADILEFEKDGYFENRTSIIYNRYLTKIYFDSELTISSISAYIYELQDITTKEKLEYKRKEVTFTNTGSIVYLNTPLEMDIGTFRIIVTVSPTVGDDVVYYSELFCIMELSSSDWILADGYWNDLGIWLDNEQWKDS